MKITNLYSSIAVNRSPFALDWGNNGLICYAAANSIAILDPNYDDSCKLLKTHAIHTNRVNTVKWIRKPGVDKENELISGSDDNLCIYLNIEDNENPKTILLKGHTDSITSLDSIYVGNTLLIVTGSADSTIRLWKITNFQEESIEAFQVIDLNRGICFSVKFVELDNAGILLTFTTDDDKVKFYGENENKEFVKIEELIGHEDWVRCLDFIKDDNGDLLLASSSQDSFIRIWKISPYNANVELIPKDIDEIQIETRIFTLNNQKFVLAIESVLQGHENWVYSVHWNRSSSNTLQLLSSSMDRTMIIWTYDNDLCMWLEKVRVGEVGGNTLGFYGGKFNKTGNLIVGHGFQGSLHLWMKSNENDRLWEPSVINSGHFREVKDIVWEPKGEFLLSASMDQTTRLHSIWARDGKTTTYHEIARPQVHGYDMQCIAVLSRYRFASGAEEKIVRSFQAPANFVENFRTLTKDQEQDDEGDAIAKSNQKGAAVPSLGLSNKIVYEEDLLNPVNEDKKFKDEYPENYFVPILMKEPPTEEYLTQNTLWPEVQKLYGHGYELYALAANKSGTILASSCKATTLEHAEILLWNTSTWKIIQRLRSHKLTVTQLKFSSDGNKLLSVSRDRRWSLFENLPDANNDVNFQLVSTTDKNNGIHERIIWCCDWTHDDKFFATGSRDGKIAVWTKSSTSSESSLKDYASCCTINIPSESITALCFARSFYKQNNYLLAIGLESGIIKLYSFNGSACELLSSLNNSDAHHLTVNKLEFRPSENKIHLASCGNDHLVRIYEIDQ
ncbi:elongator complex protein 2 [Chironomus tepperi]|uniref:elongator complex protein 2 n=1 Tax=Chironomus tepperi TaxID=113505 RepID=UPI00391F3784